MVSLRFDKHLGSMTLPTCATHRLGFLEYIYGEPVGSVPSPLTSHTKKRKKVRHGSLLDHQLSLEHDLLQHRWSSHLQDRIPDTFLSWTPSDDDKTHPPITCGLENGWRYRRRLARFIFQVGRNRLQLLRFVAYTVQWHGCGYN